MFPQAALTFRDAFYYSSPDEICETTDCYFEALSELSSPSPASNHEKSTWNFPIVPSALFSLPQYPSFSHLVNLPGHLSHSNVDHRE
jgi:hypothetical protein